MNPKYILLLLSLFIAKTYGQIDIHSVSGDIGVISWEHTNNAKYVILPELSISGSLFPPDVHWKLNLGYWDDGVDKQIFIDANTTSYSGFLMSLESVFPIPIANKSGMESPIRVFSGFSYNYVSSKVITDYELYPTNTSLYHKYTGHLFYLDFGYINLSFL